MADQTNAFNDKEQMQIELPENEASGTYSNLVMITHSGSEFILDFLSVMPGRTKAKVVKRLVLTPDHAKRLSNALAENVAKFEKEHGSIATGDQFDVPFNYRGPTPEAWKVFEDILELPRKEWEMHTNFYVYYLTIFMGRAFAILHEIRKKGPSLDNRIKNVHPPFSTTDYIVCLNF